MHTTWKRRSRAIDFSVVVLGALLSLAFTWPWDSLRIWPETSDIPVAPLDHATLEDRLQHLSWDINAGYRFVVYGDQRPLADRDWRRLVAHVAVMRQIDERLLFILDTGDIVGDGAHGDQFAMLRDILSPVSDLPYLVAVGNHELESNRPCPARANTATFLSYLSSDFSVDQMYYRKDIGPVRFLFLDTTDLLRGDSGKLKSPACPAEDSRAEAQMAWLIEQLENDDRGPDATTVVGMHCPFVQSSKKHRRDAVTLWHYVYAGRTLPDILLDGGVDLVLVGNTHTYERFLLGRTDGRQMHHVNLSGRPRTNIHLFRDWTRWPRDISGKEREWLSKRGWGDLGGWKIVQEEVMLDDAANQFALIHVDSGGGLTLEMFYLDADEPSGLRRTRGVRIK